MTKQEYIDSIKEELEKLLEQEQEEVYAISISREKLTLYANYVCDKIQYFKDDEWKLAEVVGSILYEALSPNVPGSSLIAHLVFRLFRRGIENACNELKK